MIRGEREHTHARGHEVRDQRAFEIAERVRHAGDQGDRPDRLRRRTVRLGLAHITPFPACRLAPRLPR